jgi:transporter family protein
MQFTRERAVVLAAATISFGLAAVFRKLAIDRVPPMRYQVLSSMIYALTIPLFIAVAAKYEKPSPVDSVGILWLIAATTVGIIGNLFFGYALRASNDVSMVTAISSTSPIITLMVAFLFLNERPTFQAGLGCALVVLGVIVISLR